MNEGDQPIKHISIGDKVIVSRILTFSQLYANRVATTWARSVGRIWGRDNLVDQVLFDFCLVAQIREEIEKGYFAQKLVGIFDKR